MALATKSGVVTAALDELDRSDLSSYGDDFITLVEGHCNRHLRHRKMVTSTDLTPTNNVCTLPTDFLQAERVVEKASIRRRLQYLPTDAADQLYPAQDASLSSYYTIVGSNLQAFPLSSNDIELTYYQKIPTLNSTDPNWLLTEAPHVYLRGIQLFAMQGPMNETDTPRYSNTAQLFALLIEELNNQSDMAQYSQAGMVPQTVMP